MSITLYLASLLISVACSLSFSAAFVTFELLPYQSLVLNFGAVFKCVAILVVLSHLKKDF